MTASGPPPRPQMIMSSGANGLKPQLRSPYGRLPTSSLPTGGAGACNPQSRLHCPIPTTVPRLRIAVPGGAPLAVKLDVLHLIHLTCVKCDCWVTSWQGGAPI